MPAPAPYRVFISAVSGELASYRAALVQVLLRKGLEVCEQQYFPQGPATLLGQLRDLMRDCQAVVLLVGERYGDFPSDDHAGVLGTVPAFERYRTATGQTGASYTQWEFFLAKHLGKPTYTFFTETGFVPDKPNPEDASLRTCQAVYRSWVDRTGEHRGGLTTREKLELDVAVLPWPNRSRPKPIALPYSSLGELFKGRDETLKRLHDRLKGAGVGRATAVVGKAVHGLGGVGKTRLAVEYAWRNADDYAALLFVTADTPEALRRNLAGLCALPAIDLPERQATEEQVQFDAVLRWLQQHPGWLLILDNLDTPKAAAAAEQLLPHLHGGSVLLTSRLSNWSAVVEALELDVLPEDSATEFLLARTEGRRRLALDDAALARTLAAELGRLALALEQAGSYIAKHWLTFEGYLGKWHGQRDKVLGWYDERVMQYPRSVAVTWQTSFDQLGEHARCLLQRLAWLAPEPVPESLLEVPISGAEPTDPDLREALAELEGYSLVSRSAEAPTFTVHRLVQEVTRRSMTAERDRQALVEALGWVNAAFEADPQDVKSWPTLDMLAPHARVVAGHADQAGIPNPTSRVMKVLGVLLYTKALYAEAEPLLRRVLSINQCNLGPDHPDVATQVGNLALLLLDTNRLADAEPLMRRALVIHESCLGPDHPDVAIDLNNLAALLQATGRLAEAEPLMRRALAIDEMSNGTDHAHVARDLNNLAQLLQATARLAEAEPLMRRALVIHESSRGPDHPSVAIDLSNLAGLLQDTNRLAEAEPLMRRVVGIFETNLGEGHPKLATALNNLALVLQATNRLAEAEPLLRRALAIHDECLGEDHPRVATGLNNLAQLLQDTGRLAEAEPLMRRALAIDERNYGHDHHEVATDLNNLALLLKATNRLPEAEPLMRRALKTFAASLSKEHSSTMSACDNYSALLEALGKTQAEIETELEGVLRAGSRTG